MNERATVVAADRDEPAGPAAAELVAAELVAAERSDVVFVYSGDGSQWSGMGRQLLATEPVFADAIDDLDAIFQWEHGFSPREIFAGRRSVTDIAVGQSMLFAVQVGLTALWQAYGVEPTAVVGESTGEVAAAVATGALDLTDAFRILAHRAVLVATGKGDGATAVAELAADLRGPRPAQPTLTCYSTVLTDPRERPDFDADYWVANLRRPARLTRAIGAALADGYTTFVEISPHPVATSTIEQAAGGSPVMVLPSLHSDRGEQVTFLSSLAALHEAGYRGAPAGAGASSGTEAGAA